MIPLTPYRDAAFNLNTFPMTTIDCIKAIYRASQLGYYSFDTFSSDRYESMSKLENGDCSWIIPGKFIAFSGPLSV
jgi:cell division cycle 14